MPIQIAGKQKVGPGSATEIFKKPFFYSLENVSHFLMFLNINPNFDVNKYLRRLNEFASVAAASTKF